MAIVLTNSLAMGPPLLVWRLLPNEGWAERYISPERHLKGRDVYAGTFTVRAPKGRPITLVGVSPAIRGMRITVGGTWRSKPVNDNGFSVEWYGLAGYCDVQEVSSTYVSFPSGYMPAKHSKVRRRRPPDDVCRNWTHYRVSLASGETVMVDTFDGQVSVYYDDLYFSLEADLTSASSPVYVGPDDLGAPSLSTSPPPPPGER